MNNKALVSAALAAVLISGVSAQAQAAGGKEKCYGIAKAGQNDCGNLAGTHSCAGQSKMDNDPGEWKLVVKGSCVDLGGMLKAEAKQRYQSTLDNNS